MRDEMAQIQGEMARKEGEINPNDDEIARQTEVILRKDVELNDAKRKHDQMKTSMQEMEEEWEASNQYLERFTVDATTLDAQKGSKSKKPKVIHREQTRGTSTPLLPVLHSTVGKDTSRSMPAS
jgi:chromosome segregation ATPase